MKQVALCFQHKGIARLSDMSVVEVNELEINPRTGKRVLTKMEALVCKNCLEEAGYKFTRTKNDKHKNP